MTIFFRPLKAKDIEEKVLLNLRDMSLSQFKRNLEKELFLHEREILKTKHELLSLGVLKVIFKLKDYLKILLSLEIQAQNLREQISYINNRGE